MTEVRYQRLTSATGAESRDGAADESARCIRGHVRGSHAVAAPGMATLWFCLHGRLEVETSDGPFQLRPRHFLYLSGSHRARGVARESGDWAMLSLPPDVLQRAARGRRVRRAPDALLFPVALPMRRPLLRSLVALLRQFEQAAPPTSHDVLIDALVQDAIDAQSPVTTWIGRACGRSDGHRRQVVLRLLSARNRILNEPFSSHDLGSLAAAARYSKSHFLRLFRDVFGKTPHDLLIEARMELAKDLIAGSDLAIAEVAASVGYESRYAFSRLFKKRVGSTATEFRQDNAPPDLRKAA